MMRDYRYLAEFVDDPDGGVIVTFPDVPEAVTSGADRAVAEKAASEALGLALRGYLALGRTLPVAASTGAGMISPHADDVLKIALVEAARSPEVDIERFRASSGMKDWEVAALFDPDAPSDVASMENALALLGRKFHISVEAA